MFPRLIATDLDGTLLASDRSVSPRTAAAVTACRDRGTLVVAVTARPPRVFDEHPVLAGILDAAICANGAVIRHPDGALDVVGTIPVPVARDAAAALRAVLPGVAIGVETGDLVIAERAYTRVDRIGDRRRIVNTVADALTVADRIVKLLAHIPGGDADAMLAAARSIDVDGVAVSHSGGHGLLEIAVDGVGKASTLARFAAEHGVAADEVVAFGDMPNDVGMLAWAGTSYAMGNAHPDVIAVATAVTATNDEDGVARVLETLSTDARRDSPMPTS